MSVTLDKAARDVLSAWDHYGTAECLRGWIDIMREALAQPAAGSEAAEWLMQRCEEYQRRAHAAERQLLRLRAEQEARKP